MELQQQMHLFLIVGDKCTTPQNQIFRQFHIFTVLATTCLSASLSNQHASSLFFSACHLLFSSLFNTFCAGLLLPSTNHLFILPVWVFFKLFLSRLFLSFISISFSPSIPSVSSSSLPLRCRMLWAMSCHGSILSLLSSSALFSFSTLFWVFWAGKSLCCCHVYVCSGLWIYLQLLML